MQYSEAMNTKTAAQMAEDARVNALAILTEDEYSALVVALDKMWPGDKVTVQFREDGEVTEISGEVAEIEGHFGQMQLVDEYLAAHVLVTDEGTPWPYLYRVVSHSTK